MKNTSIIGNITTGIILASLLETGKNVLIPFGDGLRYDLVIEENNTFRKVQCKTGRFIEGVIEFNLYSSARGERKYYKKDEVDLFGVYCPQINKVYLIPRDVLPKAIGYLRIRAPRNNQKKGILWAKDFEI